MKQTAVEWAFEELNNSQWENVEQIFEKAQEMFEQQIIDAFNLGQQKEAKQEFWTKGEQYYNETFNK
jgi:hypothetical protein